MLQRLLYLGARTLRRPGRIAFAVLLAYFSGAYALVLAQSTPGYTKISPPAGVTATTFTTGTLTNGAVYNFEVTAQNAAGESGPSNIVTFVIPASGSHTVVLTWSAGVGGGAPSFYNIYDQVVTIPNPPGALSGVLN